MTKTIFTMWALFAFGAAAQGAEFRVICSNGIKGAVEKLVPDFERASHQHVTIQYGTSAVLKRTMEAGEAFDLAILTQTVIDDLTKAGKMAPGSTVIAKVNLAVGIKAGGAKTDISTQEAIVRRLLAAKSVTYTKEGASTPAITKMLKQLGIADQINSKTTFQTVSGRAQETVAAGENELVFAPVSEILTVKGIEVLGLFPKEFQDPVVMTAGIGAHASNVKSAKAMIDFLLSPAASSVMKASGMDPASKGN